jgi:Cdc6-like AAA superfamily ATPase
MAKQSTNPFRFNQIVGKEYFCPRLESELVADLIGSSQNVALIGPRRTGKTSLALEVARKQKRNVIHVDVMRVASYTEVIKRLIEAAMRDSKPGKVEGFLKSLAHLRPTFSIDPVTGGTQWTVSPAAKSTPQNVIDALRLVHARCKQTESIVFIDEFQDLTALPEPESLIAQIRSEVQQWSETAIVFAGSDRDKMKALFSDPANPFYQSATVVMVDKLEPVSFRKFIRKRFERTDKQIEDAVIDEVFAITAEHPNSTQKLLHFVWSKTSEGGTANAKVLEAALSLTVRAEQDEFERILDNLTLIQARALISVAKLGGAGTNGADFLEASEIPNPASVTKALLRCVQLKILQKDGSVYWFTNPFFQVWLKRIP